MLTQISLTPKSAIPAARNPGLKRHQRWEGVGKPLQWNCAELLGQAGHLCVLTGFILFSPPGQHQAKDQGPPASWCWLLAPSSPSSSQQPLTIADKGSGSSWIKRME